MIMVKAKLTDSGNVKVTMSVDQWVAINAILSNVRLGSKPGLTTVISDFLIGLDGFNTEMGFDEDIFYYSEKVGVSLTEDGMVIELE